MIYLDTETDIYSDDSETFKHKLVLGWACSTRRRSNGQWTKGDWFYFEEVDAFWDWLEQTVKAKTTTYLWAHNTDFDMSVLGLSEQAPRRGWDMGNPIIESPPYMVRLKKDTKQVVLTDTFNIYSTSLDALSEVIGNQKGDYNTAKNDRESLKQYCHQDVQICRQIVESHFQYIDDHDLGPHCLTAASQAWATFRYRFLNHKVRIDDNVNALSLARSCYYGGWTDARYIGPIDQILYYLDINSMYPYIMKTYAVPTVLVGWRDDLKVKDLRRLLNSYLCVARVTINTTDTVYPLRTKSKLLFPTGRFETSLSTPELVRALLNNEIEKVHEVAWYHGEKIFSDYVDYVTGLRREAKEAKNKLYDLVAKLLGNSLYGKTGQQGIVWDRVIPTQKPGLYKIDPILSLDDGRLIEQRVVGNVIQQKSLTPESRYSHPAIPAHITAYGRSDLYDLIWQAKEQNVYYHDTDSLVVNEEGYQLLSPVIDSHELGKLKLETIVKKGYINGPKDYMFNDEVKLKGVKESAAKVDDRTFIQTQWIGTRGRIHGDGDTEPKMRLVVKKLSREYNKGHLLASGRTRPYHLPRDRGLVDL